MGHLIQTEVARLGDEARIEIGQEGGPQGLAVRCVQEGRGEMRPRIDLDQEITEIHPWEPGRDMVR